MKTVIKEGIEAYEIWRIDLDDEDTIRLDDLEGSFKRIGKVLAKCRPICVMNLLPAKFGYALIYPNLDMAEKAYAEVREIYPHASEPQKHYYPKKLFDRYMEKPTFPKGYLA